MKNKFTLLFILLVILTLPTCKLKDKSFKDVDKKEVEKVFTLGGAPIKVTIKLSSEEISLVDYLKVTVTTEYSETVHLQAPYLSEMTYAPLLLTENPDENTRWSSEKNLMVNELKYKFEPLTSGEFSLKAFKVSFRLEKEKNQDLQKWPIYQINTQEINYRVTSVEINENEKIRDIKGLILPDFKYRILIIAILAIILLNLFSWFLWRYVKQKNAVISPEVEKIDYRQLAIDELKTLEGKGLIGQSELNTFHTELSDILRRFIENHFGYKAKAETTEEFIREIAYSPRFSGEENQILKQLLYLADLVKFATYDPGAEASQKAMDSIKSFVENSR